MPKFSIVYTTDDPQGRDSEWLRQQESDSVEVIIALGGQDNVNALNQGLMAANGDYVALVDPSLKVSVPHWLELFQAHLESAPYQILGLSGYEALQLSDAVNDQMVRVSEGLASATGVGNHSYTQKRFFGDTHIKEVVMVDGRCVFARNEVFKAYPIQQQESPGSNNIVDILMAYQLRLAIECGQSQGVLLGVPHVVGDHSAWRQITEFNPEWIGCYEHMLPLDALQLSIWRYNLKGLDSFDSQEAQRLLYLISRAKGYQFRVREHNRISAIKGDQIALVVDHFNEVSELPEGDTFVICGAGTGLLIQELLDRPGNEVLVVEPEYGLICELLKYFDWSDALAEGRLRIMPLVDGPHDSGEITLNQTTRLLQIVLDKNQRVTHVVRGYSYHLSAPWFRRLEQGLVQYLDQRKQTQAWLGSRKKVYDVTVVSPKCAIFNNLANCFNQLGLRTRLFNVPDRSDQLSVDQTRQLLMQLAVDGSRLTVCRNRSFFETENVRKAASFERFIEGDLVNWWWDIPNVASFIDFNDPLNRSENIGFAVDMLNVLPNGSHWLPPGANTSFCIERDPSVGYIHDVSFVGQSRIPLLNQNLKSLTEFLSYQCGGVPNSWAEKLLAYKSFCMLHQDLVSLRPEIDAVLDSLAGVAPAHVYYYRYLLDMSETAAFRVAAIECLFANGIPVEVYGDNGWCEFGVVPEEHFHGLINPADLPKLYQASKVNLNLNFMQVSSTVNPKVLDIIACDGVVVSDFRAEVDVLFPDRALRPICFNGLEDIVAVIEKALFYNSIPAIKALGNEVRCKHTLLHRAQWLANSYLAKHQ